jgi:thiamine biosynthesis lipoprotein
LRKDLRSSGERAPTDEIGFDPTSEIGASRSDITTLLSAVADARTSPARRYFRFLEVVRATIDGSNCTNVMIKVQQGDFDVAPSPRHRSSRLDAGERHVPRLARDSACRRLAVAAALVIAGGALGCSGQAHDPPAREDGRISVTAERTLMGTLFRIDVVVEDEARGAAAIEAAFAEIGRTEEVLSNWSESSQISEVNRAAGSAPVVVSHELMAVLDRALHFSEITDGAFDVTFASCDGLWSVRHRRIPTDDEIASCLRHVDYRRVALDPQRSAVFVSDANMRVGVAGLAKGYRVDRAADVLTSHGIVDFVVNGGGDMRLSTGATSEPWEVKLAHPRFPDQALGTVALASGAIATSGDYQWYFERDGVRYHSILDPSSGRPARRSTSATVIAETAVDADALATGLFVMGPEEGIALAERLPEVEALIICPELSLHLSSGFPAVAGYRDLSS